MRVLPSCSNRAFGDSANFLSRSKNVVAVTNPSDGPYCIELALSIDCPAGQMEVRTYLDEQKTQQQNVSGCTGCTVNDTYRDLVKVDQGFSFVVP